MQGADNTICEILSKTDKNRTSSEADVNIQRRNEMSKIQIGSETIGISRIASQDSLYECLFDPESGLRFRSPSSNCFWYGSVAQNYRIS